MTQVKFTESSSKARPKAMHYYTRRANMISKANTTNSLGMDKHIHHHKGRPLSSKLVHLKLVLHLQENTLKGFTVAFPQSKV